MCVAARTGLFVILLAGVATAQADSPAKGLENYYCAVNVPGEWLGTTEAVCSWLPAGDFLAAWQRPSPHGPLSMFVVGWRHAGQTLTVMLAETAADHLERAGLEPTYETVVVAQRRAYQIRVVDIGDGMSLNALSGGKGTVSTVLYLTIVGNPWQQQTEGGDLLTIGAAGPAAEEGVLRASYEAMLASLHFTGRYQPPPIKASIAYRGFLRQVGAKWHQQLVLVVGIGGPAGSILWRFPMAPMEETICLCLAPDCRSVWILTGDQVRRLGSMEEETLVLRHSSALDRYRDNWTAVVSGELVPTAPLPTSPP